MVIIWNVLASDSPYTDLGADFYDRRSDPERETRRLIAKLEALGHTVTIEPAAA
jgi:transposase